MIRDTVAFETGARKGPRPTTTDDSYAQKDAKIGDRLRVRKPTAPGSVIPSPGSKGERDGRRT